MTLAHNAVHTHCWEQLPATASAGRRCQGAHWLVTQGFLALLVFCVVGLQQQPLHPLLTH